MEFRKFMVKLIYEVKDNGRNEIKEKIQEVKGHFIKEIMILKKNESEILNMKESINKLKIQWRASLTH